MKNILLTFIFTLFVLPVVAQKNDKGEMVDDVLTLTDGLMLKKGTQLRINGPSGVDARFVFIFHSPTNAYDELKANYTNPLEPYYFNNVVQVRKIRLVKGSDGTSKWVVRLRNEKKEDFSCDIVNALRVGEIVPVGAASSEPVNPTASVADELTKLKKLLDDGVLTQEEYDQQKQKLLNR